MPLRGHFSRFQNRIALKSDNNGTSQPYPQHYMVPFAKKRCVLTMVDPGFPVGGSRPCRGGVDSQGGYILKILHVETKEFGPLGGVRRARPPRSANG